MIAETPYCNPALLNNGQDDGRKPATCAMSGYHEQFERLRGSEKKPSILGTRTAIAILRLPSGDARAQKEESCFLVVQGHAVRVHVAVHDHLGMLVPKSFGDVAVPANRRVRFQNLLKIFRGNLVPLEGFAFGIS